MEPSTKQTPATYEELMSQYREPFNEAVNMYEALDSIHEILGRRISGLNTQLRSVRVASRELHDQYFVEGDTFDPTSPSAIRAIDSIENNLAKLQEFRDVQLREILQKLLSVI